MTTDQIKAIAEEYSSLNPPCTVDVKLLQDGIYLNATMVFEPFLRFLNERYCIAEREKVKAFYNGDTFGELDFIEIVSTRRVLKSLFGTSMFNQDEE